MIYKILIFFLFLPIGIFASKDLEIEKFNLVCIPKSGTHLLTKYISLVGKSFNNKQIENHIDKSFKKAHPIHPKNPPYWLDVISSIEDRTTILLIRDLRDILISYVFWLDKRKDGVYLDSKYYNYWKNLTFDEKLLTLINPPKIFKNSDYLWLTNFNHWDRALEIKKLSNVYVCRFENLIGPKGGGDKIKQKEEITQLAKHIGIDLQESQITYIQTNLFGNQEVKSWTFRKGQIGEWKKHYKLGHIEAFKKHLNHYLVAFGYEDDDKW